MRTKPTAMTWFAILYALTTILAFVIPPTFTAQNTLGVSALGYHLLIASLLVPYGLIWASGFYAYETLERYADSLASAAEGHAFKRIALGVRVLAWGLILSSILALSLNGIQEWQPSFQPAQTIINHYITLAIAIAAFTLIGDGAYQLAYQVRVKRKPLSVRLMIIVLSVIGILFARFVVLNSDIHNNPYYLSIYPLLLTIVVPYVYAWAVGFIATYDLRLYANKVKGVLYQQALGYVANGLTIVILVSIAVQYLTAAFARNTSFSTGAILLIIYSLLIVEAAGFLLVALGSKRLKKIEEV